MNPDIPNLITLLIDTGNSNYPIYLGQNLLDASAPLIAPHYAGHKCFIVTDEQVAAHYLEPVKNALNIDEQLLHEFIIPAGEQSKSFASLESLCEQMLSAGPDRNTLLIALGGGVVGDLTGFIASILLRGLPFIQIPTTLLAQVDSSVGGKTAINSAAGKNLIGSFYQPKAVLIDSTILDTLPQRELRSGYAEVLKYGLLGDQIFYQQLLAQTPPIIAAEADRTLMLEIIQHCCEMKARIVSADEKERGQRALLNLGHTFAHSIEKAAEYDGRVLHGEAVALGCLMAMRLSETYGNISPEETQQYAEHLRSVGMATSLETLAPDIAWDASTLTHYCYQDKKASAGGLTFITLEHIGDARIRNDIPEAAITPIFEEYLHG